MDPITTLWIYIVLLVAGGLMGFIKARSRISLISAVVFAGLLSLCALGKISPPYVADIIIALLLILFGVRYSKSKKFMPSGLMVILSLLALLLRVILK